MMNTQMLLQFLTLTFLIIKTMSNGDHFGPKQTFSLPIDSTSSSHHSVPSLIIEPLKHLKLDGNLSFENFGGAGKDYGNRFHSRPLAVLYPKSVSDISSTIKLIFGIGSSSKITVAAKGHGHSVAGQAQAPDGVVINMESLGAVSEMHFHTGELPFVDVSGGELWINILNKSLKYGLAPKSWTDYLYLTVGGTLSNGGISGQAFRFGLQIDNVYQLEVVTGKGEVVTCSDKQNSDLFHGVLGGLGQFGIITKARIALQPAPKLVKWIRAFYSNFSTLTRDQEYLISIPNTFDYVEGFVETKNTSMLNNWRSSLSSQDRLQVSQFNSEGKFIYSLEAAKYFNPEDRVQINETIDALLSKLSYDQSTISVTEISYPEFLNRVHASELKLRKKGLWDVPHAYLDLFIPRSKIHEFAEVVFGKIITDNGHGPILFYPFNKSKWGNDTSMVIPDGEDVIYLVGFLSSAMSHSTGEDGLENLVNRNNRILSFCKRNHLGMKQYLPHYIKKEDWKAHFGYDRWEVFSRRKSIYDPSAILAPGQRIFQKAVAFQSE